MPLSKITKIFLNYLKSSWVSSDYRILLVSFAAMVMQFLYYQRLHLLPDKFTLETALIIPIVMIGFSIGGVLSASFFKKDNLDTRLILSIAVSMLLSLFLSTKLRSAYDLGALLKCSLFLVWPFIFLGIFFGKIFLRKEQLGVVFLNNGIGLAFGAFLSGKIFKYLGDTHSFLFIYLILILVVFIEMRHKIKKVVYLFSSVLLVIFLFHLGLFSPKVRFESQEGAAPRVISTRYSELSRTDIVEMGNQIHIFTNGGSPTPIAKWGDSVPLKDVNFSGAKRSSKPLPYSFDNFNKILVIGSGGGSDVLRALESGCTDITAIEINPKTVELLKNEYKEYSGGLYLHPYVKIINGEGRHFIESSAEKYDLIIIPNVDAKACWRASSPIALEGYLYTKEAFKRYWEIINKGGACLISWPVPKKAEVVDRYLHGLRLFQTAASVVPADYRGDNSILLFQKDNPYYFGYYLLLFKGGFSQEDYAKANLDKLSILYSSAQPEKFRNLRNEYIGKFDINETSDDRPTYQFFRYWWSGSNKPLINCLILVAIFTFIAASHPALNNWAGFSNAKAFLFVLLGMSFIVLEITLIEKISLFLGSPVYANQLGLCAFLLFSGIGGYLGVSIKERDIWKVALGIAGMVFLYRSAFDQINNFLYLPQQVRFIIVGLAVSITGLLCGMPFAGLLSKIKKRNIAYAFDGLGSVAGGLSAWYGIVNFGFDATLLLSAAGYLVMVLILILSGKN
ncbi:MAG: hypothetical protein KKC39_03165 [Candidatus Omnitrophica bacterium]|nr:hypothetical protein [Candidatus Omnitrophota bacterium]MBU4467731.1 hypothetical protein [Candidatus Omnitrophota bacterium]MCG2707041.1 hypothetical protein [Candidatus Omnitrophota bacterium]